MLCSDAFLSVDGDRNGRVEKEEIKGMLQRQVLLPSFFSYFRALI